MTVAEIARSLDGPVEVEGDLALEITGVQSLEEAGPADVSFVEGRRGERRAHESRAGCLVVSPQFAQEAGHALIRVPAPRAAFACVITLFHPPHHHTPGVDPSARVAMTTEFGDDVTVGPYAVIEGHTTIGAGTVIGAGCYIGDKVHIGAQCTIHSGVHIYHGVRIGDRAVLHSGCVIGADGFGFIFQNERYEKFPQVGTVEIADDVEIGANSCVDRAALGATRIGHGTKLDNMVHIGHNCRIGRHVVIAAQTGLSGGVEIGDYAVIGGQVGIGDKARIESRAVLGSGCGVLSSKIVRAGEPVWGTPARPLKQHLQRLAWFDRLPQLLAKLGKG